MKTVSAFLLLLICPCLILGAITFFETRPEIVQIGTDGNITFYEYCSSDVPQSANLIGEWLVDTAEADIDVGHYPDTGGSINGTQAVANARGAYVLDGSSAVHFDGGDDYIVVPDNDIFTFALVPFTASCWVKTDTQPSAWAFAKNNTSPADKEWQFVVSGTRIYINLYDTAGGANYIGRLSTAILTNSVWQMITMVYDGGDTSASCKLYLNATQVDTGDSEAGSFTTMGNKNVNVTIGAESKPAAYLDGKANHFRIWDVALTGPQISILWSITKGDHP